MIGIGLLVIFFFSRARLLLCCWGEGGWVEGDIEGLVVGSRVLVGMGGGVGGLGGAWFLLQELGFGAEVVAIGLSGNLVFFSFFSDFGVWTLWH